MGICMLMDWPSCLPEIARAWNTRSCRMLGKTWKIWTTITHSQIRVIDVDVQMLEGQQTTIMLSQLTSHLDIRDLHLMSQVARSFLYRPLVPLQQHIAVVQIWCILILPPAVIVHQ